MLQTTHVVRRHRLHDRRRIKPAVDQGTHRLRIFLTDIRRIQHIFLKERDITIVIPKPRGWIGRVDDHLQRASGSTPQRANRPVSETTTSSDIVPSVQRRTSQTFTDAEIRRWDTGSGSDTSFTSTLHSLHRQPLKISANNLHIGTSTQKQGFERLRQTLMFRVELLNKPAERFLRNRRIERNHHLRSCSIPNKRMLVLRQRIVSSRISQHSRQPGAATKRMRRIRQRPEMRNLRRFKKRQLVTVRINHAVTDKMPAIRLTADLIHHISSNNHRPLRMQPDELLHTANRLPHPIRIPIQINVQQHLRQQVTGLAARERLLENRQPRITKQTTRPTLHKRLKLESHLREHQQPRMNRRRDNRIPSALHRSELSKRHRRSHIPLPVIGELLQHQQIVVPRQT